TEYAAAMRTAEKDFGLAQRGAETERMTELGEAEYAAAIRYADAKKDLDLTDNGAAFTAAVALSDKLLSYDLADNNERWQNTLITAAESRGTSLSLAERDNTVNTSLDKRDREHRLTAAFATYQAAAADHAKSFAECYAAKYAFFVTDVAAADETASKAFAADEKTLADADAPLQKTWNDNDTTALKDFYVEAAGNFLATMQVWASAWNTPWT